MKKIFTLSFIGFITAIFLSSCKTNLSITKRHYNKGYHITGNHHKNKPGLNSEKQKTANTIVEEPINTLQVLNRENISNKNSAQTRANNNVITAGNKKNQTARAARHAKNPALTPDNIKAFKNLPIIDRKNFEVKKPGAGPIAKVFSLFWIVILAIFLLWFFGFLAGGLGMGLYIHFLLAVVAIFLVLWIVGIV